MKLEADNRNNGRLLVSRCLYAWRTMPDPRRLGTDSLLGRIYRGFIRFANTLITASNMNMLATARRGQPPKKANQAG